MNDIDFDELDRAVSSTLTPTTSTDTPVVTAAPTTAPSPAARRGGRFMDVVHPSSDMRGAPAVPQRPASTAPAMPVAPAPTVQPAPAPVADWPEPIDSPFLADTKVEKRPLGGEMPTAETPVVAAELEPTPEPEPELEPQLESEPESATIAQPEVQPEVESAPEVPAETTAEPVEATPAVDTTPTSITPQYTEAASSAEPSRPIFDTEAYHQPLAHPEKKKSGVFVVLWIIGLIVLGAGLGAAMYFFVLPLL